MRLAAVLSAALLIGQFALPFAAQSETIASLDTFETFTEKRIGTDIPCASWINPQVKPWAVLLCIHGLSLHASNYEAFGRLMSNLGVPTYAIDVRGFGSFQRAENRAAAQVDFKGALEDIHDALLALRAAHPELPIVLAGESMGGALALQAGALNQDLIDGLICSVPASKRTNQKMNTARVAVGMVTRPNREFNAGPSVVRAAAGNSPELAEMWTSDEMTRMKLSAKELLAFAVFTSKNAAHAQEIKRIPVLFIQGAKDKLISPAGTFELYQKLGTPHKTMHVLNSEHLVLEYHQFDDQLIDFISGWMQRNAVPAAMARVRREDESLSPEALAKAEGHLKVAEGFLRLKDTAQAEEHLLKVVEVAPGSHYAQDAELLLCALPEKDLAPSAAEQPRLSDEELKFVSHDQALDNSKPSVVMFFAKWIVGSQQVGEAIEDALTKYGGKVNFVKLNADDPANREILKKYAVRPIPAVIYLSADNRVVGYTFGYPGEQVIESKIRALVTASK